MNSNTSFNTTLECPRRGAMKHDNIQSSQSNRRKVTFQSDDQIQYIESKPMTKEEIDSQWYTCQELDYMPIQCDLAIKEDNITLINLDDKTLRGLESFTRDGRYSFNHNVSNSIHAVLDEQSRIRLHNNGNKEEEDPTQRLASVYGKTTAYCKRIAQLRARQDAQECNVDDKNNTNRSIINKNELIPAATSMRKIDRRAMRMKRIEQSKYRRESRR